MLIYKTQKIALTCRCLVSRLSYQCVVEDRLVSIIFRLLYKDSALNRWMIGIMKLVADRIHVETFLFYSSSPLENQYIALFDDKYRSMHQYARQIALYIQEILNFQLRLQ